MIIKYVSPAGSFTADGGEGNNVLKIRGFEGLGLPSRSRTVVKYPGRHGQSCTSFAWEPRTITLALDLLLTGDEAKEFEYSMLMTASEDGYLQIGDREIGCSVTTFVPAQIHKGDYPRYTIQLICDYPYFRDIQATAKDLFRREGLIKSTFQLPSMFSTLTSDNIIVNDGETDIEPVIELRFDDGEAGSQEVKTLIFVLQNQNTGAAIELDMRGIGDLPGSLTVDIPNRKIYSPTEDMTHLLADNIFLCDFVLARGENRITAAWDDSGTDIYARVFYRREYLGVRL